MKLNESGKKLIKNFEGLRLKAYKCPAGIWTIGYGHTGPDVREGLEITQAKADELFDKNINQFEEEVTKLLKVAVSDNEFSALVSFAYNCGIYALEKSTLLKKLNSGDVKGASNEFIKWNKANGKELSGLTTRRIAERDLFLKK